MTEFNCPCKINLTLEITAKRSDGYHELCTIFYRVSEPHDTFSIRESDAFHLTSSDPSLPADDRNLAFRAAHLFAAQCNLQLPHVEIHLEKRIPIGAGLGGGSSDAATMLLLLKQIMNVDVSQDDLMSIGRKLGADVPFFLSQQSAAIATGIGDRLQPIPLRLSCPILIIKDPNLSISTKAAYQHVQVHNSTMKADVFSTLQHLTIDSMQKLFRNDFEPSLFARHPSLAAMKDSLYGAGATFALLSGSGAALFGLFETEENANHAALQFEREGKLSYLSIV